MTSRRNTIQKDLVRNTVYEMRRHVTANEVYEFIKEAYPTIGKGTVYRNLDILVEEGALRKVEVPNGPNRFDFTLKNHCNGVQREHNKKLNNGLPILHKVPPKRDYGRYFCIMAKKGGTSHGGLTEKLSLFFHAKKQEVNAYGR